MENFNTLYQTFRITSQEFKLTWCKLQQVSWFNLNTSNLTLQWKNEYIYIYIYLISWLSIFLASAPTYAFWVLQKILSQGQLPYLCN